MNRDKDTLYTKNTERLKFVKETEFKNLIRDSD